VIAVCRMLGYRRHSRRKTGNVPSMRFPTIRIATAVLVKRRPTSQISYGPLRGVCESWENKLVTLASLWA